MICRATGTLHLARATGSLEVSQRREGWGDQGAARFWFLKSGAPACEVARTVVPQIKQIVVLGGGSAGLIAALTLRRLLPAFSVRLVRSPDIGIIGVGEGTTQLFPRYFFETLRLPAGPFYAQAEPTWKLGIKFIWGPREHFFYTFSRQLNHRWPDLPRNSGFYCDDDMTNADVWSALMAAGKAFPRRREGGPEFAGHQFVGFHIENHKLVTFLEAQSRANGVAITDGTVSGVERSEAGVGALLLESGERIAADLFIDCSGFRSELLGKALEEPFESFGQALFCDRAVIGGWPRRDEPLLPYTSAETMEAGWCWQIEHEHWINRGYVYSSAFLSDEAAREELVRKNPKVVEGGREVRVVRFRSGRYQRMWVGNVVGIGNASGFVEPLEATALATIMVQCRSLAFTLFECMGRPTPSLAALYNKLICGSWDEIRDFIALHYRFNTRLDTPFWQHCIRETPLGHAQTLVDFYEENGPTAIHEVELLRPSSIFGMEGYLAMLVGQKVPHRPRHQPSAGEWERWQRHRTECAGVAQNGFGVSEVLPLIRSPQWKWG
jgi:tryptophan 7-halogenase